MILTCPQCATRYQASDEAFLPSGRRVRCAKCGHSWHQDPPPAEVEEEPAPPPPAAATASAAAVAPQPAARHPSASERLGVAAGWIGLVVVVLLIGWAAVSYRQQVAEMWPQSASVYAAVGLPVNVRGLAFTDVRYHRENADKQTVLAVSGKLVNVSGRDLAVPPIRVTLSAENGRELYHWDFTPQIAILKAGQSVKFTTRLSSPPPSARHLTVQFADAKG